MYRRWLSGVALIGVLYGTPVVEGKPSEAAAAKKPPPASPAPAPKKPAAAPAASSGAPAPEKAAEPKPSPAPPPANSDPPAPPEKRPDEKPAAEMPPPEPAPEPPSEPPMQRITRIIELLAADPAAVDRVMKEQFPDLKLTWNENGDPKEKLLGPRIAVISGPEGEVAAALRLLREMDTAMIDRQRNAGWVIYTIKQASPTDLQRIVAEMFPDVSAHLGPQPAFLPGIPTVPVPTLTLTDEDIKIPQSQIDQEEAGRVNLLILSGPRDAVERARLLLEQIDVPVPQVFIEVTVLDSNESFSRAIGINWDVANSGVNVPFRVGEARGDDSGGILFGRLTTDPFQFNALLQAAIVEDRVKLLANPKILAVNRRPAHIFIGDEINYAVSIQVTDKGTSVKTERLRTGIQMDVFASASPDGSITLQLHPEVAALKRLVAVPGGAGVALPEISRRFTDSTVRLRAGETLVIGGLIADSEQRTVRKVPLLGDLPLIGGLFRHSRKFRTNSEIMIFIRASSVAPPPGTLADTVFEAPQPSSPERIAPLPERIDPLPAR
ncbi:MAG: hypothetical protein KY468_03935 [Armatimonadetes bacterium]|nr:hypothetical protein [Armatimonadota bacterium]